MDYQVKCPVGNWKLVIGIEKRSRNWESSVRAVGAGSTGSSEALVPIMSK